MAAALFVATSSAPAQDQAQQGGGQGQGAQQGERAQGQERRRGGDDQEGRRLDPEEMRQRMMEGLKRQLGVNDEEWQVLEPKVQRVLQAQMNARAGGMGMGARMGRGGGPGGPGGGGQDGENQSEVAVAARELRTVLQDENAQAEQIVQRLEAFRAARKKAEAELATARDDLQGVLTQRQEAQLVMMGLLE